MYRVDVLQFFDEFKFTLAVVSLSPVVTIVQLSPATEYSTWGVAALASILRPRQCNHYWMAFI